MSDPGEETELATGGYNDGNTRGSAERELCKLS